MALAADLNPVRRRTASAWRGSGGLALACAAATWACSAEDSTEPLFTVTDSAGVQIVESSRCSWGGAPWTVAEQPEARFGGDDPLSNGYLLGISDALRLADGRVVAADQQLGRVRIFGPAGEHLSSFGGAGDGPGEFRSLSRLIQWRDRLWVFDVRRSRLTTFDQTGAPIGIVPIDLGAAVGAAIRTDVTAEGNSVRPSIPPRDVLPTRDGGLFAVRGYFFGSQAREPTLLGDSVQVFSLGTDAARPFFSFSGSWARPGVHTGNPPRLHPPIPSWATDGSSLYFTAGGRYDFSVVDETGRIQRIVRRSETPPAFTEADELSWRHEHLDGVPNHLRGEVEAHLDMWVLPETFPAYVQLQTDAAGNVWAREFGDGPEQWDLYRSDGACLGAVGLPAGLRLLDVGVEHVLGAYALNSDLEYVQIHRINRNGEGARE